MKIFDSFRNCMSFPNIPKSHTFVNPFPNGMETASTTIYHSGHRQLAQCSNYQAVYLASWLRHYTAGITTGYVNLATFIHSDLDFHMELCV